MKKLVVFLGILFSILILVITGSIKVDLTGWMEPLGSFIFGNMWVWTALCIIGLFIKFKPDPRPKIGNFAYYSMIVSTGMGIGTLFWGFSESLMMSTYPDVKNSTALMLVHWGFLPWICYALFVVFELLDDRYKILPKYIRIFKEFAFSLSMIFGIGYSFSLGVISLSDTLYHFTGIMINSWIWTIIISLFVAWSVLRGIDKGIKVFSIVNTVLTGLFTIILLFLLPDNFIKMTSDSCRAFLTDYVYNNTWRASAVQIDWTLVYWAWWINWIPQVSKYLAIISRGRSIRNIIINTVLWPALSCMIYMLIATPIGFANATSDMDSTSISNICVSLVPGLFILFMTLMGLNYITGADSQAIAMDEYISSEIRFNKKWRRVFWVVIEMFVVALCLYVGGNSTKIINDISMLVVPFIIILSYIYLVYIVKYGINRYRENINK